MTPLTPGFAGYQPTVTGIVWIGYDSPRSLGDRETGGGLSLPVWISFMETALKGVAVADVPAPEGVVNVGGEWYYDEFAKGAGVSSLGLEDKLPAGSGAGAGASPGPAPGGTAPTQALPPADEKKKILDLFKN